jgi:hypothetical protein
MSQQIVGDHVMKDGLTDGALAGDIVFPQTVQQPIEIHIGVDIETRDRLIFAVGDEPTGQRRDPRLAIGQVLDASFDTRGCRDQLPEVALQRRKLLGGAHP